MEQIEIHGSYDEERALQALTVIFGGQRPPFEIRWLDRLDRPVWVESPEEVLCSGAGYFGPVGRKRDRVGNGMGKENVAVVSDVVWLDLDAPDDVLERDVLVVLAEQRLEMLRACGLCPSVYIFSGQGSWAFWKLAWPIPSPDTEVLNRRLAAEFAARLGRRASEHNIDRVARLPGAWHQTTGLQAFVMAVTGVVWRLPDLDELLVADVSASNGVPVRRGAPSTLRPGLRVPTLSLPADLASYVRERPSKQERKRSAIDGSQIEQAIVCRLVNRGCSDEDIAAYFDHHQLPRHMEERGRTRGYGWLEDGIVTARGRTSLGDSRSTTGAAHVSQTDETLGGGDSPVEPKKAVRDGRKRWGILRDMVCGQPGRELVAEVMARFGISRAQVLGSSSSF